MRAAHKHRVKRVVYTGAAYSVCIHKHEDRKELYDENDWSDESICSPYQKSKTLAEKAAWDYHSSLPEDERFEFVSLDPVMIVGPNLIGSENTSSIPILRIMRN
jgi:nucleoside-diphosphate-sugar epimerase